MTDELFFFDARLNSLGLLRDVVECYDDIMIVVSDGENLDDVARILNGLSFSIVKSPLTLDAISFVFALLNVHSVIYKIDESGAKELAFRFENQHEVKWLNDAINVFDFVSKFSENSKFLMKFSSFDEVYTLIKSNLNSLENISVLDCKIMFSGSFIATQDILLRKNDTNFDNIILKEFDAAKLAYEAMLQSNIYLSQSYRRKKLELFSRAAAFKSSSSSNIIKVENYPIVYKFYSSYLFQCAVIKKSLGFLSSAFMYYFRALENYCDGFLIYSGIAEIRDLYNNSGNLKKNDVFLVNGQFMSGFGGKWNVLINLNEVKSIPVSITNYLSDLIKLRNNFIMTHGDVRVNEALLNDVHSNIHLFITELENNINQTQTLWSDLFDYFSDFCNFQPSLELKDFFEDNNLISVVNC